MYEGLVSFFFVMILKLCIADIGHGWMQSWEEVPLFLNHPLRSLTTCILRLFLSVNEGITPFLFPTGA